jgi:hypothetical protein
MEHKCPGHDLKWDSCKFAPAQPGDWNNPSNSQLRFEPLILPMFSVFFERIRLAKQDESPL